MSDTVAGQELVKPELMMRVALEGFEGPLDLLLHLIQKHEIDVKDIPIRFITEEYLRYLEAMVRLDLGIVGEYLVMAATLLHIKSQSILPKETKDDDGEQVDPREELVRRLLEYQRFKTASQDLQALPQLYRDHHVRLPAPLEMKTVPTSFEDIETPSLWELVDIFRSIMARRKPTGVHEVTRHELSIKEGIHKIADELERFPRRTLQELVDSLTFPDPTHATVIAFMSVLEMAKLRMVRVFQLRLSSDDLVVERAVLSIRDIALQLDFSDPTEVLSREEAAEGEEPLPLDDFDEDAELDARKNRPRRRKARPLPIVEDVQVELNVPEVISPQPAPRDEENDSRPSSALEEDIETLDDALLAFISIRPEIDNYDVDAVLAYAASIGVNQDPDDEYALDIAETAEEGEES